MFSLSTRRANPTVSVPKPVYESPGVERARFFQKMFQDAAFARSFWEQTWRPLHFSSPSLVIDEEEREELSSLLDMLCGNATLESKELNRVLSICQRLLSQEEDVPVRDLLFSRVMRVYSRHFFSEDSFFWHPPILATLLREELYVLWKKKLDVKDSRFLLNQGVDAIVYSPKRSLEILFWYALEKIDSEEERLALDSEDEALLHKCLETDIKTI